MATKKKRAARELPLERFVTTEEESGILAEHPVTSFNKSNPDHPDYDAEHPKPNSRAGRRTLSVVASGHLPLRGKIKAAERRPRSSQGEGRSAPGSTAGKARGGIEVNGTAGQLGRLVDKYGHAHSEGVLTSWSPIALKVLGVRREGGSQ